LDDLQIRDGKENKTVILRGPKEAIAKATEMVQETLANAKQAREDGPREEGASPAKKEPRAKKEKTDAPAEEGSPTPVKAAAKPKPVPKKPELDSQEHFPTMGGGGAAATPKTWGKKEGSKKTEADEPEAFPTLDA